MTVIRILLAGVVIAGLVACVSPEGEDEVDPAEATQALERQRAEVREAARSLLVGAEKSLPGTTRNSTGGYRGCESAFSDEFRNFQYLAQARIDAPHASGSAYLERLRPVLQDAGFTVEDVREESNGFTTLAAAKGDLSASFVHTGGAFVGLDVSGQCIEVPEGQRDTWLRKQEPEPEIR